MASTLVSAFTRPGQTIYDPFCGSGTVAFEAWAGGRNVIANDLSPYAAVLTQAKLFPPVSWDVANWEMELAAKRVNKVLASIDLRRVPKWVREFFHPETLRETLAWTEVLRARKSYFLLSCLLGILHHQRPGFLSYPSSHAVPYLRGKNFPSRDYPELYEYRAVRDRLERKARRALRRLTHLDPSIRRLCSVKDAAKFTPNEKVHAIITSPPYMRQLDYARDNRLRLWFLGLSDWKALDNIISPPEEKFVSLFRSCLRRWQETLVPGGKCVLVLGDTHSRYYGMPLPDAILHIASKEVNGYEAVWQRSEAIPNNRRVRRGYQGSRSETVLVLRKKLT